MSYYCEKCGKLVQDNEYLENVEKRCNEVNEKYTQALEVANKRFEEIEDLKEQVEYQDQWRKEYLDRIDKAIEYINQHIVKDKSTNETIYIAMNIENVLNILKGEK